jgi:hypothetical protein
MWRKIVCLVRNTKRCIRKRDTKNVKNKPVPRGLLVDESKRKLKT